jgi:hypothetical protein
MRDTSLMATAASFTSGSRVDVGMVVRLTGGRLRGHAVVTKKRYVERGRRAGSIEYTLAPVVVDQWGKSIFAARVVGERFFTEPTESVDADVARDRIRGVFTTTAKIQETKRERAEEGRVALESTGLERLVEGDQVRVKFRNATTIETFVCANWKTGKIAIRQAWNKSGVRWIPASLVERLDPKV